MIQHIRCSFAHDKPVLPGLTMAVLLLSIPNILTTFYPRVDPAQAECFWMGVGVILLPAVLGMQVRASLLVWLPLVALMPATVVPALRTSHLALPLGLGLGDDLLLDFLGQTMVGRMVVMLLARTLGTAHAERAVQQG